MSVSIILPTYNRAKFLPEAFDAVSSQTYKDWELIVVDDGSTDDTACLVSDFKDNVSQPVRYIRQENKGAYSARNTGLDHATGQYIAFYDSDDLWLQDHLHDCAEILEDHQETDWVFDGMRSEQVQPRITVDENNIKGLFRSKAFSSLRLTSCGNAMLIDDPKSLEVALMDAVCGPLQTAMIRKKVFNEYRFDSSYRNGQDRFVVIDALLRGFKFAFINKVNVVYQIHEANDSVVSSPTDLQKRLKNQSELIEQYESLLVIDSLSRKERFALRKRIFHELFWGMGYALHWQHGYPTEAMRAFRSGLQYWMWSLPAWKTYILCTVKRCM